MLSGFPVRGISLASILAVNQLWLGLPSALVPSEM